MNLKNIMKRLLLLAVIVTLSGCSTQKTNLKGKLIEIPYKPVAGDALSFQGARLKITCNLRAKGEIGYLYEIKKGPNPLVSSENYLMFDVYIVNMQRREIRIPKDSVRLVGKTHNTYNPVLNIYPDSNETRFLVRNIYDYQNTPFIYGILVFKPVPDEETELKLQIQIDIGGLIEHHYVIFNKNEPDPRLVNEIKNDAKQRAEADNYIDAKTGSNGMIASSDYEKIEKRQP